MPAKDRVIPDELSPNQLFHRYLLGTVMSVAIPFGIWVLFEMQMRVNPTAEIYGFFTGASFFLTWFATVCVVLVLIWLIRIVHYLQGYDVPHLEEYKHAADTRIVYFFVHAKNYSDFGYYMLAVALMLAVGFILQAFIGFLWNKSPYVLLAVCSISIPVMAARYLHRRNRRRRLEAELIMDRLEGKR